MDNFCEKHPKIRLIEVQEENGLVSKRCVLCDMNLPDK